MKYLIALFTLLSLQCSLIFADCAINEIPVIVTVETANFGSDTFWELTDDITGTQYGTSGFFLADNTTYVDTVCVPNGRAVTFTVSCCVNNMGYFKVEMLGATIAEGENFQFQDEYQFVAKELPEFEVELTELDLPQNVLRGPQVIKGKITNLGQTTIERLDLNWRVGGFGAETFTQTLEEINLLPFGVYEFEHEEIWQAELGETQVIVSLTNINGEEDNTLSNNNIIQSVEVLEVLVERNVLYESFSNASCSICALADPNYMNTVVSNPAVVGIGYHSQFPGFDPMYQENPTDVEARMDYYQVFGVPQSVVEGGLIHTGTQFILTSRVNDLRDNDALVHLAVIERQIQEGEDAGKILIEVYVTPTKDMLAENLRLQTVITEREVRYTDAPGTNGLTDFYYVMRRMLPNAEGTALSNLQAYQTQKFTFEYTIDDFVRNVAELRTTVFIENTSNQHILQSLQTQLPTGEGITSNVQKWGTNTGSLTAVIQHNACAEDTNGRIEVELFGATEGVSLLWSNGETGTVIENLQAGVYDLQLENIDGSIETFSFEVFAPKGFEVEVTITPDTDAQSNGTALVEVLEGRSPFTYTWFNGMSTPIIEGLEMGTYEVSVTDAVGCTQTLEVVIDGVTDIDKLEEGNFRLYPNPAVNEVTIEYDLSEKEGVFEVFDLQGKRVMVNTLAASERETFDNLSRSLGIGYSILDIRYLKQGLYLYRLSLEGKTAVNGKLIIE